MTPEVQQQMQGAFQNAAGGFGDQMGGGFAAGLQGQIGPNSYVDAMKGQIADDANRLKQQNLGWTRRPCGGGRHVRLLWLPRSGRQHDERRR